jgi:hypothetical protein
MIMIEDGLFYDGPSSLYDTSRCKGGFAYAIDQYGDLISGDDAPKSSIGKMLQSHQRFNHSSLNAGKDVICAGVMKVENGRLTYIDNMSGHYKPTKRNLLNALELLRGLNVDLQRVQVACLDKPPLANKPKIFVHHNATQFLANPLRRPEEILDH